jgi:hypothetical protein
MNLLFRMTLAVAPLMVGATSVMAAQPLILDSANMDRVTAGSKPLFERIASVLDALPRGTGDADQAGFQSLNAEQMALLARALEGGQIAFRQTRTGELAASHQLASGEKLVIVKEFSSSPVAAIAAATGAVAPPSAAALPPQAQQVTTQLVNPGETVNVRQTSASGVNYLYIRSTGNSAITVTQRNGF